MEIELNTASGEVVAIDVSKKEIPDGAARVANIISETLREQVEVRGWHPTHNNDRWVVKPDTSCGIEVCTPILKGRRGLGAAMRVAAALRDAGVRADERCSLHVHVNIADLNEAQLATVLAYYLKCEKVLFDSIPARRKVSPYCRFVGLSDLFTTDFDMDPTELIRRVSATKYHSANAYHFVRGGGFFLPTTIQTVEFRVGEGDMCLDPELLKNWVRFLLHFVEATKDAPYPRPYRPGAPPADGLLWLDRADVFDLLKFSHPGVAEIRDWFAGRLIRNSLENTGVGDTALKKKYSK